jgi:glycosyltransferase involved in cell wall biosynthesis
MRIGIDARNIVWNQRGGLGHYAEELVRHLLRLETAHHFSLFRPDSAEPFPPGLPGRVVPGMIPGNDYHLADVGGNCLAREAAEAALVAAAVDDERLDLYHVPQNGIGLPARKNCRFVITLHDVIPLTLPWAVHSRYVEEFTRRAPEAARLADAIVTPSTHAKGEIVRLLGVPAEKVHVTPLAASDIYQPRDKAGSRSIMHEKYGISCPYILYVGGFNARKNIETVVTAFGLVRRRLRPACLLVLVGDSVHVRPELKRTIADLGLEGSVVFPGRLPREDMPVAYTGADLFVSMSLDEGFGLPALEAMACGTPAITSDTGAFPEVGGGATCCTNPRDPERLAERLLEIIDDPATARRMAQLGLRRSRDFSWRETAAKTLEVYESLSPRWAASE